MSNQLMKLKRRLSYRSDTKIPDVKEEEEQTNTKVENLKRSKHLCLVFIKYTVTLLMGVF